MGCLFLGSLLSAASHWLPGISHRECSFSSMYQEDTERAQPLMWTLTLHLQDVWEFRQASHEACPCLGTISNGNPAGNRWSLASPGRSCAYILQISLLGEDGGGNHIRLTRLPQRWRGHITTPGECTWPRVPWTLLGFTLSHPPAV